MGKITGENLVATIYTSVWAGARLALSQDLLGFTGWTVLWDATIDRKANYRIGDKFVATGEDLNYSARATDETRVTKVLVTEKYNLGTDVTTRISDTVVITVIGYNDMAKPITGKAVAEKLYGGELADLIKGKGGNDLVKGGAHHDRLYGGTGDDAIYGGTGHDIVYGEADNDRLHGNDGNDIIYGGTGRDTVLGGEGGDRIYGGDDSDRLYGHDGDDVIDAGRGNDTISGGNGSDILRGNTGADTFYGGAYGDIFVFKSAAESTFAKSGRDTIKDFEKGLDKIDVSYIDANPHKAYDQAFGFIGTNTFSGKAGELRYDSASSDTYVYGDINGDRKADFAIRLDDAVTLSTGDFVL